MLSKSKGSMSLDEHDSRCQRKSQLAQQDKISNNRTHESSLRPSIGISDRVDQPSDDRHYSNDRNGDGEVDPRHEVHDQSGGGKLYEVVVGSLGVVELVPLLIGKLVGVAAVSHVRVPALLDLLSGCGLVLFSEVRLHEVFSEDLPSDFPREEEADEQDLEGYEDSHEEDVAVVCGDCEGAAEAGAGVDDLHMHFIYD